MRPQAVDHAELAVWDQLRAYGATLDELARSYNVSRGTISRLHA